MIELTKAIYGTILPFQLKKYQKGWVARLAAGTYTFFGMLFIGFVLAAIATAKGNSRPEYKRYPNKFKKTIKEGLFFDTTYYHEK